MEPKTLHLPQTEFNQRANGVAREPELLAFWKEYNVFANRSDANRANNGSPFVLHDGPVYSNGQPHCGHVLNKTLKDVLNKYHLLSGKTVDFVPGWDCHGLPTELQAVKKQRYDTTEALRTACGNVAGMYLEEQKAVFERFGFMGRWDKPYKTMNAEYEVAELEVFGKLYEKGLVYKAKKPVYFSPSTQTVLAEAELEYYDRVDTSVYFLFPVEEQDYSLAVWTTMPWTLFGNKAVGFNKDLSYGMYQSGERKFVLVNDRAEDLSALLDGDLTFLCEVSTTELYRARYTNPLNDDGSHYPLLADFVTATSGTGLVHLCPAHGIDDFEVCEHNALHGFVPNLKPQLVSDKKGKFLPEFGFPDGTGVLDNSDLLFSRLAESGYLLATNRYNHSYPHDWRTKKPVLFLLTEQFFMNLQQVKLDAVKALDDVEIPNVTHRNRLVSMLNSRKDWCISRQRKWGLPLPLFLHKTTNEVLFNRDTLNHLLKMVAVEGSNCWFSKSVAELLPESYGMVADQYEKCEHTLDVWFDSGTSWAAVVGNEPLLSAHGADVYMEGSDQHRGWFQSSLLTSVAVTGKAPYRKLITHGFVLDANGRKMSKSEGNVVDPLKMVEKSNTDVVRLWVASVDYTEDVLIGDNILKQMVDSYFRLRNSFRFLLGNVFDYNATEAEPDALNERDALMLTKLVTYRQQMRASYESFDLREVYNLTMNFFTNMSKGYFDLQTKHVLYELEADSVERRNCQYVMTELLNQLSVLVAPVLPFLAEDVHQHRHDKPTASVFEMSL